MPLFVGPPEEINITTALDVLQLFIVNEASQSDAIKALDIIKDFVNIVKEEYKL